MKWLLINPKPAGSRILGKFEPMMVPFLPMGLAYLSAILERRGHQVRIHDQYARNPLGLGELIRSYRPEAIGISCLTPTVTGLGNLVEKIRALVPESWIILGNYHATLFHDQLLDRRLADIVVRGEGEETIIELSDCLAKGMTPDEVAGVSFIKNGKTVVNPDRPAIADLDSIPLPAWDLFDLSQYVVPPMFSFRSRLLPVMASRGCPFNCYFCAQNALAPGVRKRDIVKVVDEIEYFHRKFGIDTFWFADAIFPHSHRDAKIFCAEIRNRRLHHSIRWITETRVDMVDEDLISLMKKAGLMMILFGLESGDERVLAQIKPGASLVAGQRAIAAARRSGVLTLGLFIVGLPGETVTTIKRTISFAKECGLDYAKFNRAVPYPGSRFYEDVAAGTDTVFFDTYSSYYEPHQSEDRIAFSPAGIGDRELIKLQKKAFASFYLRPSLIWRHLSQGTISPRRMIRGGSLIISNYLAELTRES